MCLKKSLSRAGKMKGFGLSAGRDGPGLQLRVFLAASRDLAGGLRKPLPSPGCPVLRPWGRWAMEWLPMHLIKSPASFGSTHEPSFINISGEMLFTHILLSPT